MNVTEVYSDARPYLKGFFNAMEVFHSNRDVDGWRLQKAMDEAAELDTLDKASLEVVLEDYPEDSKITDELLAHVNALLELFEGEVAAYVPLCPASTTKIRYMAADASVEALVPVLSILT